MTENYDITGKNQVDNQTGNQQDQEMENPFDPPIQDGEFTDIPNTKSENTSFEAFTPGPTEEQINIPQEVLNFEAGKSNEFGVEKSFGEGIIQEPKLAAFEKSILEGYEAADNSIPEVVIEFSAEVSKKITAEATLITLETSDMSFLYEKTATVASEIVMKPIEVYFLEDFLKKQTSFNNLTQTHISSLEKLKSDYDKTLEEENEKLPKRIKAALLNHEVFVEDARQNMERLKANLTAVKNNNEQWANQQLTKVQEKFKLEKLHQETLDGRILGIAKIEADEAKAKLDKKVTEMTGSPNGIVTIVTEQEKNSKQNTFLIISGIAVMFDFALSFLVFRGQADDTVALITGLVIGFLTILFSWNTAENAKAISHYKQLRKEFEALDAEQKKGLFIPTAPAGTYPAFYIYLTVLVGMLGALLYIRGYLELGTPIGNIIALLTFLFACLVIGMTVYKYKGTVIQTKEDFALYEAYKADFEAKDLVVKNLTTQNQRNLYLLESGQKTTADEEAVQINSELARKNQDAEAKFIEAEKSYNNLVKANPVDKVIQTYQETIAAAAKPIRDSELEIHNQRELLEQSFRDFSGVPDVMIPYHLDFLGKTITESGSAVATIVKSGDHNVTINQIEAVDKLMSQINESKDPKVEEYRLWLEELKPLQITELQPEIQDFTEMITTVEIEIAQEASKLEEPAQVITTPTPIINFFYSRQWRQVKNND